MEKHYDGADPEKPLPPEHFTEAQQEDARNLGDGSPGVEPREPGELKSPATEDADEPEA